MDNASHIGHPDNYLFSELHVNIVSVQKQGLSVFNYSTLQPLTESSF